MFTVELQGTHYRVRTAKTHPDYHAYRREMGGDLMLLYFDNDDSTQTSLVQLNTDDSLPALGTTVGMCGKGLIGPSWSARPPSLQEVTDLQVAACPAEISFENETLCTKPGKSQANVCDFDSGSPLLLLEDNIQIGITSMGQMDSSGLCATVYVGFTQVSRYHSWIQDQLPTLPEASS